jgi:hypothetical protein
LRRPDKPHTFTATLEEGPVTLTFPAALSSESYEDLADHLAIFLRKAKRRSGKAGDDEAAN